MEESDEREAPYPSSPERLSPAICRGKSSEVSVECASGFDDFAEDFVCSAGHVFGDVRFAAEGTEVDLVAA